jgi:hypothetical protein
MNPEQPKRQDRRISTMLEKNEKSAPANDVLKPKLTAKMPKKCPRCGSKDILEGDGGDWYYCNNCMCQMDKDGNVVRPGYWG